MIPKSDGHNLSTWAETDRLTTHKGLKRYGLASALIATVIVLVSAGMPGHFLWKWVGIPLAILFVYAFSHLLFFGGRALFDLLDKTKN